MRRDGLNAPAFSLSCPLFRIGTLCVIRNQMDVVHLALRVRLWLVFMRRILAFQYTLSRSYAFGALAESVYWATVPD